MTEIFEERVEELQQITRKHGRGIVSRRELSMAQEIDALRTKSTRLQTERTDNTKLQQQVELLHEALAQRDVALRKYGQDLPDCAGLKIRGASCDCGFRQHVFSRELWNYWIAPIQEPADD